MTSAVLLFGPESVEESGRVLDATLVLVFGEFITRGDEPGYRSGSLGGFLRIDSPRSSMRWARLLGRRLWCEPPCFWRDEADQGMLHRPTARCVNYRVGLFVWVPERIGSPVNKPLVLKPVPACNCDRHGFRASKNASRGDLRKFAYIADPKKDAKH